MESLLVVILNVCMIVEGSSHGPPSSNCPSEWAQFNNTCFFLEHDARKSYQDALEECQRNGADLTSIHSREEQILLEGHIRDGVDYFIGLNDQSTEDEFVWTDGTPVDFTNWGEGQQDNFLWNGGEDCAGIWEGRNGKWNDFPCDDTLAFICRRVLDVEPSTTLRTLVTSEDFPLTSQDQTSVIATTTKGHVSTAEYTTIENIYPLFSSKESDGLTTDTSTDIRTIGTIKKQHSIPLITGVAVGVVFLVITVFSIVLYVVLRRKQKNNHQPQSGRQFDATYSNTNGAMITSQQPKNEDKYDGVSYNKGVTAYDHPKENDNDADNVYHDIRETGENNYAAVKPEDDSAARPSDDAEGLVHIYARSEYGGISLNEENKQEGWVDNSAYATSDDVTTNQEIDQAGVAYGETEGWVDNSVYVTSDDIAKDKSQILSCTEYEEEGWMDNSIYDTKDYN